MIRQKSLRLPPSQWPIILLPFRRQKSSSILVKMAFDMKVCKKLNVHENQTVDLSSVRRYVIRFTSFVIIHVRVRPAELSTNGMFIECSCIFNGGGYVPCIRILPIVLFFIFFFKISMEINKMHYFWFSLLGVTCACLWGLKKEGFFFFDFVIETFTSP